jgi:uncharacterized membrane protein
LFAVIFSVNCFAQDFTEEFENLINIEKPSLLPEKMIFSQRILWGEKGLLRKTGIVKLSLENREKELVLRERMLKAHQIIGYITFAGMIYQGILGGKLYNGDYSVYDTHKKLGNIVTASYFTGAALSLFSPPPLVNRKREGLNNIRLHKILANVHVPAMVITNIYADKQYEKKSYKEIHKVSAYTAVASYTLAMVTIIFDF